MDQPTFGELDHELMQQALEQAKCAAELGEVPVGAVLVVDGAVVAQAHNQPIRLSDPTAHAELICVRRYCQQIQNYRLPANSVLYVTLEPCSMCLGALTHARLGALIYGANEPRSGSIVSAMSYEQMTHFNHQIQVSGGLLAEQSGQLLRHFFRQRRQLASELERE